MVLLAVALTAGAPAAFPQPPQTRAEALGALQSPDAARRAEAVVWIANRGGMDDAPLLHERLRDESAFVRGFAEQGLWLLWSRSGDAAVDRLMALGIEAMQAGRHSEAIGLFSEIIETRPDFAEGWNKRATVYYLAGQYGKSIADCHEVLKRNPGHFGALSGMGQIYLQLEDDEQALQWYRRALEVNPNMLGVEMSLRMLEERLRTRRAPGRST
ncbi:MAG TPA: tetratricopeptide repeat protein [Burkholderiales bacterium]|jgi:tetratricopeptide (TPR) repeat protein|nr:tetratricopeptide repeat protein [Burkholderiales bacterium]